MLEHPITQRNLYLAHVFVRDAFYGVGNLGWVFLLLAGVPMMQLIVGLVVFRIFESFVAMPIAYRIVPILRDQWSIGISLILQALFIFLFPLAATSTLWFALILIVLAAFDVLYWPVRDNIERTVSGGTLANRVSLARALSVLAQAGGLVAGGIGISLAGDSAFYVAAAGIMLSGIPILGIKIRTENRGANLPFFRTMWRMSDRAYSKLVSLTATGIIIFSACVKELIDLVLPLALAYFAIQIDTIGIVLALFILAGFAANAAIGHISEKNRRTAFVLTGLGTLACFLALPSVPEHFLAPALAILGLVSGPWLATMDIVIQEYVREAFSRTAGGFFIEFVDDAARIVPHLTIIFIPLAMGPAVFLGLLAGIGVASSAAALAVGILASRRLKW